MRCAAGKEWAATGVEIIHPDLKQWYLLLYNTLYASYHLLSEITVCKEPLCKWLPAVCNGLVFTTGLLNFGTLDILSRMVLSGAGVVLIDCGLFSSIPGLDSLDATSILLSCEAKAVSRPCRSQEKQPCPWRATILLCLRWLSIL